MRFCFALFTLLWLANAASGEDASSVALTGLDGQQATLTFAGLDALPQVKIEAKQHGATHVFEGALLGDVLAKVGAPAGKAIHGAELTDIIIIEARDGYKVALDLAGIRRFDAPGPGDPRRPHGRLALGRRKRAVSACHRGRFTPGARRPHGIRDPPRAPAVSGPDGAASHERGRCGIDGDLLTLPAQSG